MEMRRGDEGGRDEGEAECNVAVEESRREECSTESGMWERRWKRVEGKL